MNEARLVEQNELAIRLAAKCQFRPLDWAEGAYDWGHGDLAGQQLREWQGDLLYTIQSHLENPDTRYQPCLISIASGHGIGKSAAMGIVANWALSCWPGARGMVLANTEVQLRTKTSPEIAVWRSRSITADWFDATPMSIKARDKKRAENWRMDFISWSKHNPQAVAGLHNIGNIVFILMDEASEIPDVIPQTLLGAMTDENTVCIFLMFGNPTLNTGYFRETFRKYRHRWYHMNIDSRTVEGTNRAYLDGLVADHGEDSDYVKIRVRGMFPSSSARQFISVESVEAAQRVHLRLDQYNFAPVILGVDPAWTGDDNFVVYKRQGLYTKKLLTVPKNDNDVLMAQRIALLEDEHKADAVFIDFGFGTGIKSIGDTMGRTWELVNFADASPDKGYLNMRAYIWGQLAQALREGLAIDPNDQTLYDDLIGPELVPRIDGKKQLESKEDMKKRGLPSPNDADALALTFARPVVSKRLEGTEAAIANARSEDDNEKYDPYAALKRRR